MMGFTQLAGRALAGIASASRRQRLADTMRGFALMVYATLTLGACELAGPEASQPGRPGISSPTLQVSSAREVSRAGLDLGTLGAGGSATAINNAGRVVGTSTTASGESHAFLWIDGVMTDLGTLGGRNHSCAVDVNDRGQVLGLSAFSSGARLHRAFL